MLLKIRESQFFVHSICMCVNFACEKGIILKMEKFGFDAISCYISLGFNVLKSMHWTWAPADTIFNSTFKRWIITDECKIIPIFSLSLCCVHIFCLIDPRILIICFITICLVFACAVCVCDGTADDFIWHWNPLNAFDAHLPFHWLSIYLTTSLSLDFLLDFHINLCLSVLIDFDAVVCTH